MPESWELSVVQIKPDHTRATCKTERPAMSGSNGIKRYNGVEQDDEGAYVYYDEHIVALRRAKVEVLELAARELCMYCNDPGNWAPMSNSGYHQCNTPGPNMTRCGATKIHALRRELDARAAQIEEGE